MVGLTGDVRGLRKLRENVASLAGGPANERMLGAVRREVNTLLRDEFAKGSGPDNQTWAPTVRGKPALISRKLPFAFESRVDRNELRYFGKTKRDLLSALHAGHTFPPRSVAKGDAETGKGILRFNRRGRLISRSRLARMAYKRLTAGKPRKASYRLHFAKAHTVGQRVLPPRPIVPAPGAMPLRWQSAINAGVFRSIADWAQRAGAK